MSRSLLLFRDDLRLSDHPALTEATRNGREVVCLLMLDEGGGVRPLGGAARWWLHGAIEALRQSLHSHKGDLLVLTGDAEDIVPRLVRHLKIEAVYGHYRYDAASTKIDDAVAKKLKADNIEFHRFHGSVLRRPGEVTTRSGQDFKVFTAFWREFREMGPVHAPLPVPKNMHFVKKPGLPHGIEAMDEASLLPTRPNWAHSIAKSWTPGEEEAQRLLKDFVEHGVAVYNDQRNDPSKDATSHLSPYLHFGHISPRQIFHALSDRKSRGVTRFESEIGWRDFAINNLFYNPKIGEQNLRNQFDDMAWRSDRDSLRLWQKGQTGIPIVDAGMRQLWRTGWMHNRVRMVVGSFLTKHLLIKWQEGEKWFWDTLVDADAASNAMNWQWVAGTGIDAAPYFRIFNPVLQGEKFDKKGLFVRTWVPELDKMPDKFIHHPWDAPPDVLSEAGVTLGKTYPKPCVDLKEGRARALTAFGRLKDDA